MKSILDFMFGLMYAFRGHPLQIAEETRRNQLLAKAPVSVSPASFQVQPDGEVIHVTEDIADDHPDDEDELSLRRHIGQKMIQAIIRRVQELGERRSQLILERTEKAAQLDELRSTSRSSMIASGGELEHKRRDRKRLIPLMILTALSAILFDAYTLADCVTGLDISNLLRAEPFSIFTTAVLSLGMFFVQIWAADLFSKDKITRKISGIFLLVSLASILMMFRLHENYGGGMQSSPQMTDFLGAFFFLLTVGLALFFHSLFQEFRTIQVWLDTHDGDLTARRQTELQLHSETRSIDERIQECEREIESDIREFENAHRAEESRKETEARQSDAFAKRLLARLATFRFGYLMGERTKKAPALKPVLVASIIIPLLFLLFGCGYYSNRGGADCEVITDQSTSVGSNHINSAELAEIGTAWVHDAERMGGGRFEILLVGHSFDDVPVLFSQDYPTRFPAPISEHKAEWGRQFIARLSGVADSLPQNGGSAIAEAIYRASLRIPDKGETAIFVYSDLREVNKRFDLERSVPTYTEFADWLKEDGITPMFPKNTRLQVIGVHPYSGPNTSRLTAQNYDRTIRLWDQVFRSWNVKASISETLNLNSIQ